jgi:hypothetical protein
MLARLRNLGAARRIQGRHIESQPPSVRPSPTFCRAELRTIRRVRIRWPIAPCRTTVTSELCCTSGATGRPLRSARRRERCRAPPGSCGVGRCEAGAPALGFSTHRAQVLILSCALDALLHPDKQARAPRGSQRFHDAMRRRLARWLWATTFHQPTIAAGEMTAIARDLVAWATGEAPDPPPPGRKPCRPSASRT